MTETPEVSGAEYASEDPGFNPRPIDALRDEVAFSSRRSFPMFTADEVQTALDEIDRLDRNVRLCIEHLDILKRSFGGQSKYYTCALCGAGPEEDHTAGCELTVHRALLVAAGRSTSNAQEER
jgi:hypothetical protein